VVYRGYFEAGSAQDLAERLRQERNDVYVGGVVAYSTLGWFDDPLLNTFLFWPDGRLAELVFHELAHQLLYVPGDTAFNESFATFVGRTGARLWLARCGSPQQLADYEDLLAHRSEVLAIIETARDRLEGLYQSGADDAVKRDGKRRILSKLQEDYAVLKARRGISSRYDRWFEGELNNAKVAAVNSYSEYLPAFGVLFSSANGGFEEFYRNVDVIADLAPEPRQARLEDLMHTRGNAMNARASSDIRAVACPGDGDRNEEN
jgi:predicted aminopeptidase